MTEEALLACLKLYIPTSADKNHKIPQVFGLRPAFETGTNRLRTTTWRQQAGMKCSSDRNVCCSGNISTYPNMFFVNLNFSLVLILIYYNYTNKRISFFIIQLLLQKCSLTFWTIERHFLKVDQDQLKYFQALCIRQESVRS